MYNMFFTLFQVSTATKISKVTIGRAQVLDGLVVPIFGITFSECHLTVFCFIATVPFCTPSQQQPWKGLKRRYKLFSYPVGPTCSLIITEIFVKGSFWNALCIVPEDVHCGGQHVSTSISTINSPSPYIKQGVKILWLGNGWLPDHPWTEHLK